MKFRVKKEFYGEYMESINTTRRLQGACSCNSDSTKQKNTLQCAQKTPPSNPVEAGKSLSLQNGKITKITVKCNCGFPNTLFLRGEGIAGFSWNKGIAMKNVKPDEWTWETDKPFIHGQFKVLINDKQYEVGENHPIDCGTQSICNPRF